MASDLCSLRRPLLAPPQNEDEKDPSFRPKKGSNSWRNYIAFWLLGLTNNFAYVVMLSAAHDIISGKTSSDVVPDSDIDYRNQTFKCNDVSTGAILLADILPALIIKILAPFIFTKIHPSVVGTCLLNICSFLLTANSSGSWMSYLGVACASMASGLGETTFLKFSSNFHKDMISGWSGGTGGAGIVGSIYYAGLISLGVSAKTTLLTMLFIPVMMAICFWVVVKHPQGSLPQCLERFLGHHEIAHTRMAEDPEETKEPTQTTKEPTMAEMPLTMKEKVGQLKPLAKYMIPLGLVYLFEYFINQGLFELIFIQDKIVPTQALQYRWFQVIYQIGVFISRSTVRFFKVHKLWLLPILQFVNVGVFLSEVMARYMPSVWIMFGIVLFEGLLGGASYVSTFDTISEAVPPKYKAFSLGVTSVADSVGITAAAFLAIPTHNLLCGYLSG